MSSYAKVIRGIVALATGQVLTWVGAMVLLVLLPRYLGDINLGKLSFAFAVTALFGLLADLGVTTYLARQVARDASLVGALTRVTLLTRLPFGALAAGLAAAFVWIAGYDEITRQIVHVLCVGIVVGSLANTFGAALQGLQRMRALAVTMAVGKVLQSGLIAALLLNGAGALEVATATVFATAVGAGVGAFALRGELFTRSTPIRRLLVPALIGGLPFFVWQAALMVYGQIDFVMLSILTQDAVVGWYAAAYRLVMLPAFTPIIVTTAAFPALAAVARDASELGGLAKRSVQLIGLTTIPMAIGILILPDKIVQFLGYPSDFDNSIVPMMFLSLHVPLAGIDMVIGTILGAIDKQRQWAMTGVAAAVLNPALNLVAITVTQQLYGNGAIGAAIVTTLTELFMLGVGLRLLPAGVLPRSTLVFVTKCLAAGAFMAVVVSPVREAPLVVTVALGAIAYGAGSLALRTITFAGVLALILEVLGRKTTASRNPISNTAESSPS